MSEERGNEESLEMLRNMWDEFMGLQEVAPGIEDNSALSGNEGIEHRKFCRKIRSILRRAMARGTKHGYRQGCLAGLAFVDEIDPTGKGFHVTRETFAPGEGTEHARQ